MHPEADARPEPEPEPESASARDANVNAAVFGAVGSRAPRSQSNFYDSVGDNHADMGAPDTLPAVSSGTGTGTTTTALEKPISVVPMSGALSPPPPPPKDTTTPTPTTTTPNLPARQDTETHSTSSDAAIPSMGSEDKLGGREPEPTSRHYEDDEENVDETDKTQNDSGKQKKGASKLLGKMKEKLKTASHGQKA